jgi:WhiB family redox-sensing transcriptional regulator
MTAAITSGWQTPGYCSDCHANHPGSCGCPCHLPVGAVDWRTRAACLAVDPGLFFPERGVSARKGKSVCRGCPVRVDCLQFALENGMRFGIYGGLSERERRTMNPRRSATSASPRLCASGRHRKNGPGRCLECKKERDREREGTRVRDQAAVYARRAARARGEEVAA